MDARKPGLWEGCTSPKGSKWLADNLEAVDENVKLMLKLIEEDGDSFAKKAEMYYQKRPQLISCVDELHGQYCLLAERYYHLFKEFHKNGGPLQAQNEVDPLSQFYTPVAKLGAYQSGNQGANSDINVTSPENNSDLSLKSVTVSLSASLSDTDSDLFNTINNISLSSGLLQNSVEMGSEYASIKEQRKLGEVHPVSCTVMNEDEEGNCGGMLNIIKEYEEELRVLNMKLKPVEQEFGKLKLAVADKDFLITDLQSKLQVAHMDSEEQKSKLHIEEEKAAELQNKLTSYRNDVTKYEGTISDLKAALCHVQEHLFVSVAQLESDIGNLLEQKLLLESDLAETKIQNTLLDSELRECKELMMKMEASYRELEMSREEKFERLKAEQFAREELVTQLNKSADELKSKHEALEAQKIDTTALLQTLSAELNSQNNKVRQLDVLVQKSCWEKDAVTEKLNSLNTEVILRTDVANQLINDLKSQLNQNEEELGTLRAQIAEGAENKREAIRQLCFSLDHYKSGYRELCQAFIIPNQRPVSAS